VVAFTEFGGYAEYAIAQPQMVRALPDHVEFTEAAGLPVVFVTAYLALFGSGMLHPGARVLIHAAAGGLGQAAVQLALRAGAEVFGTAGSAEKIALLKSLGVPHSINYRAADFAREITETVGPRALDLIVDSVGGSFIRRELKLLAPGGRLVLLGVGEMSGRSRLAALGVVLKFPRLSTLKLLAQSRAVVGLNVLQVFRGNAALARHAFDEVMKLYVAGEIKPPISTVLPLVEAHRAHELLESRESTGKIVLSVEGR
jgi:NADPH2:quinone reductase